MKWERKINIPKNKAKKIIKEGERERERERIYNQQKVRRALKMVENFFYWKRDKREKERKKERQKERNMTEQAMITLQEMAVFNSLHGLKVA